MTVEFTKCDTCGIIFPNLDGAHSACPKCRNEAVQGTSSRDLLRSLKGALRDAQSRGAFLTIKDLSRLTEIEEDKIWGFIHRGEIETASFSDPEVRSFVARKKKELMQSAQKKQDKPEPAAAEDPGKAQKPRSGLHFRREDDAG